MRRAEGGSFHVRLAALMESPPHWSWFSQAHAPSLPLVIVAVGPGVGQRPHWATGTDSYKGRDVCCVSPASCAVRCSSFSSLGKPAPLAWLLESLGLDGVEVTVR